MNRNTVTGDFININLRQLGATSIKEFNSIMHIAEFDLGDGLIVSYVFIIDFITEDLKRFENAKNSHNFNTFLLISHLGHHITENIEQLFLNYNVDADKLEAIENSLEDSLVEIQSLFEKSDKLNLPKD